VGDAYFDVAGVPVIAGREFEPRDALGGEAVALLNEQAAKRLFPGEDPIGRQVTIWNKTPRRIVGVVGDVRFLGIQQPVAPAIYAPYFQMPTGYFNATIKTQLPLSELRRHLQAALSGIDPALALSDVWRLQDLVYRPLQPLRTGAVLATLLSTVLLAISVTGLYALTAASAAAWKPEFAVRMAFGARPRQIVRLVLVRGGRAVLVGTIVGTVLALAISRALSLVYALGSGPTIAHLLIASLLTTLAALPALLAPALRAGIVAPFVTLKTE
jgi:hypothetical protein